MTNDNDQSKSLSITAIGKRIELEKIRLNLKSPQVCSATSLHPSTYRNYELGKRDMPISILATLETLGFDTLYILTGNTSTNRSTSQKSTSENRLIKDYNDDAKSPALLSSMNNVENTFILAGAVGGIDYTYIDLANIGIRLLQYNASTNE